MTPEMIERARGNAREAGAKSVEFRLGEAEKMPVEDETVVLRTLLETFISRAWCLC